MKKPSLYGRHIALSLMACFACSTTAWAQQSAEDLAKASANPVADLISLPIQSNWERNYGPGNQTQYTLNIQPVIPFQLNTDWNLITRTIIPIVRQPALVEGQGDAWGLGDTALSLFFSPRATQGGVTWGVGPAFLFPTASKSRLGTEKWAAGPTGVILQQTGNVTYGVLANHLWSFAGDAERSRVNTSFANPFFTYAFGQGWSTTLQAEVLYNWEAYKGHRTTMPLIGSVGKVVKVGSQMMSVSVGYKHYVETPFGRPDNGIRVNVNLLFPK